MKNPLIIAIVCLVCFVAGTRCSKNKQTVGSNSDSNSDTGMTDFRDAPAQSTQQPEAAGNRQNLSSSQQSGGGDFLAGIEVKEIPNPKHATNQTSHQQPRSSSRVMSEVPVSSNSPTRRSTLQRIPQQVPHENRGQDRSVGVGQRPVNRGKDPFHRICGKSHPRGQCNFALHRTCGKEHEVGKCPYDGARR